MNSLDKLISSDLFLMYFTSCMLLNVLFVVGTISSKGVNEAKNIIKNALPLMIIVEIIILITVLAAKAKYQ